LRCLFSLYAKQVKDLSAEKDYILLMKTNLFNIKPRRRLINYLREKYPEYIWQYDFHGHAWRASKDGKEVGHVRHVAALAPRYDGDDDTFIRQTYFYRDGQTPLRIWSYDL